MVEYGGCLDILGHTRCLAFWGYFDAWVPKMVWWLLEILKSNPQLKASKKKVKIEYVRRGIYGVWHLGTIM